MTFEFVIISSKFGNNLGGATVLLSLDTTSNFGLKQWKSCSNKAQDPP